MAHWAWILNPRVEFAPPTFTCRSRCTARGDWEISSIGLWHGIFSVNRELRERVRALCCECERVHQQVAAGFREAAGHRDAWHEGRRRSHPRGRRRRPAQHRWVLDNNTVRSQATSRECSSSLTWVTSASWTFYLWYFFRLKFVLGTFLSKAFLLFKTLNSRDTVNHSTDTCRRISTCSPSTPTLTWGAIAISEGFCWFLYFFFNSLFLFYCGKIFYFQISHIRIKLFQKWNIFEKSFKKWKNIFITWF